MGLPTGKWDAVGTAPGAGTCFPCWGKSSESAELKMSIDGVTASSCLPETLLWWDNAPGTGLMGQSLCSQGGKEDLVLDGSTAGPSDWKVDEMLVGWA